MKTRNLMIVFGVAAMATLNALAADTLLSPKASAPSKTQAGYNSDPNLAATGLQSAPPRALEGQIKIIPGKSVEVTSSLACTRKMSGSPKMIGTCADQATEASMSCCSGK